VRGRGGLVVDPGCPTKGSRCLGSYPHGGMMTSEGLVESGLGVGDSRRGGVADAAHICSRLMWDGNCGVRVAL